jgi:two-component system, cell cycle response regulator
MGMNENDTTLAGSEPRFDPEDTVETARIHTKPVRSIRKNPFAAVVVLEGAEIGRQYILQGSAHIIGRGHDADVCIHGDGILSRHHARIETLYNKKTGTARYVLIDLKSTNHTYVNGEEITRMVLTEGAKIQVGETTLKFVLLDEFDARFHREVRHRISYDALTGLLTHEAFFRSLDIELKRSGRNGFPLAVLMMDLDMFKRVNDTYGHPAGNAVLAEVGRIIRGNLRDFDLFGRYGGEEFMCALVQTEEPQALAIAERLRETVCDSEMLYDSHAIRITLSIGIAQFPQDGKTFQELVARADTALYQCKRSGRNRVILSSQLSGQN